MKFFLPVQAAVALSLGMAAMAGSHQADVVVYGDAAGGVTAAVQAVRMGKSTVLVSQYGHLGGMTSSGLGLTDIGNDRILGDLSREFYHKIYQHYQKPGSWIQEKRDEFTNVGQGLPALNEKTELASTFEPKVAEAVFDAMVNTQRFVHNGMVKNEGDIQSYIGGKAYGISYRAIVPKADECENLLAPWALSSTHIAFGSIRMEPVFMVLGQSAATAACMAIDDGLPIQKIPYDKLRERLIRDGQKLE